MTGKHRQFIGRAIEGRQKAKDKLAEQAVLDDIAANGPARLDAELAKHEKATRTADAVQRAKDTREGRG